MKMRDPSRHSLHLHLPGSALIKMFFPASRFPAVGKVNEQLTLIALFQACEVPSPAGIRDTSLGTEGSLAKQQEIRIPVLASSAPSLLHRLFSGNGCSVRKG